MRKGFHIPYYHSEALIAELGDRLLGTGIYDWIEIKFPHDILGFDGTRYERAIRALVREYDPGVSIHVPTHYDIGMWSERVRWVILEQVRASLDFGAAFGASIAAIHPGTLLHMDIPAAGTTPAHEHLLAAVDRRKQHARSLTVAALDNLGDYAAERGITLALENVLLPEEIVYTARDLRSIVEDVDHASVRALYDCGHAHRCSQDQEAFVTGLGDHLVHVHVNDNDGSCDLHGQIGEGTIDFQSMFRGLTAIEYSGAVVVETSYVDAGDLAESARRLEALAGSGRSG